MGDRPNRLICFYGGPGTGKSTLADAVKLELKLRGLSVECCPEYARDYFRACGPSTDFREQMHLITETTRREDSFKAQYDVTLSDAASFQCAPYMMFYRPEFTDPAEERRWEYHYRLVHELARERIRAFDHVFYVPAGRFPAREDPERYNAHESSEVGTMLRAWLDVNRVPHTAIEALDLQDRTLEAIAEMERRGLV